MLVNDELVKALARDLGRISGYQADMRREAVAGGYAKKLAEHAVRYAARKYGESVEAEIRRTRTDVADVPAGKLAESVQAEIMRVLGVERSATTSRDGRA